MPISARFAATSGRRPAFLSPRNVGILVAGVVILTFVIGLVAPALKLPDWVNQLALTAHLGQPMVGTWDWVGMGACVVLAIGGLALGGWGVHRRDIAA